MYKDMWGVASPLPTKSVDGAPVRIEVTDMEDGTFIAELRDGTVTRLRK